jgi:ubiquinone/menaquinone biosynthesis C-methylase UbiE
MGQAYGPEFAQIYDRNYSEFAVATAPIVHRFFEQHAPPARPRTLLDLACGSGQLAQHFLDVGYTVTGIDLSESMLEHARHRNEQHVQAGTARFLRANAADFTIPETVSLVVSTYDALNLSTAPTPTATTT